MLQDQCFFDISQSRKTHSTLTEKLMLFDTFEGHFANSTPKVSINDRFYRVFPSAFLDAPECSRTNAFLMICRVVNRHQLLVINLMLFLILFGAELQKGPQKSQ